MLEKKNEEERKRRKKVAEFLMLERKIARGAVTPPQHEKDNPIADLILSSFLPSSLSSPFRFLICPAQ